MTGAVREGQLDPTPRAPQVPRWPGCRCEDVGKGGCHCYEDDGLVSHRGVHHEGADHGVYRGGEWARVAR